MNRRIRRGTLSRCWIAVGLLVLLMGARLDAAVPPFRAEDWAPDGVRSRDDGNYWYSVWGFGLDFEGKKTLMGLSFRTHRDFGPTAPLPMTQSHGYQLFFGRLHEGDLIPMFGHLYRIPYVNTDPDRRTKFAAVRIPDKDVPQDVRLREDCYAFPLQDRANDQTPYSAGALHGRRIMFAGITMPKTEKDAIRAKIGTLADVEKEVRGREKDIVWKWVGVGDVLEIGGLRHKVANIVPPKNPQELKRGDARMVGWIELEWKPLPESPKP